VDLILISYIVDNDEHTITYFYYGSPDTAAHMVFTANVGEAFRQAFARARGMSRKLSLKPYARAWHEKRIVSARHQFQSLPTLARLVTQRRTIAFTKASTNVSTEVPYPTPFRIRLVNTLRRH
jgi:hypothetical protein